MPEARLQLADWLLAVACTHIARERTGVDWRPVVKLLEDHLTVLVVNAHHITAVPGRQTDLRTAMDGCLVLPRPAHGSLHAAAAQPGMAGMDAPSAERGPSIGPRSRPGSRNAWHRRTSCWARSPPPCWA